MTGYDTSTERENGQSSQNIASHLSVPRRRVEQLCALYRATGKAPTLGKGGRKSVPSAMTRGGEKHRRPGYPTAYKAEPERTVSLDESGETTDDEAAAETTREDVVTSQFRERLLKSERDNRFLRKDSNERKTMEEVFDRLTLLALRGLLNREELAYLNGVVRAGKEARLYWGVAPDGTPRAVKIYLTSSAEFKKRLQYIVGDRRFGRVPGSNKEIIKLWVQKEFKNLQTAYDAGIRVPKPYVLSENILIMEYIGVPPAPAPLFLETEVDERDYRWTTRIVGKLFRKAGLVHADLSEYNIFKFGKERVLFDMGSSVVASHPLAKEFLRRDLFNVVRFFKKRGISTEEPAELLEKITS